MTWHPCPPCWPYMALTPAKADSALLCSRCCVRERESLTGDPLWNEGEREAKGGRERRFRTCKREKERERHKEKDIEKGDKYGKDQKNRGSEGEDRERNSQRGRT